MTDNEILALIESELATAATVKKHYEKLQEALIDAGQFENEEYIRLRECKFISFGRTAALEYLKEQIEAAISASLDAQADDEDEFNRRTAANFDAVADGMAPPYPSLY
jgi:hypothetical protein